MIRRGKKYRCKCNGGYIGKTCEKKGKYVYLKTCEKKGKYVYLKSFVISYLSKCY